MSSLSAPMAIRRAPPNTPIPFDYATTPHGTIYSSTPRGTRIIYDRSTLLTLANSPLSHTPPKDLAYIPGVTKSASAPSAGFLHPNTSTHQKSHLSQETHSADEDDDEEGVEEEDVDEKLSRSSASIGG
ncbi:eukaryotic translation initiation factor 4E binding protein-domain-containing protein, partial [Jimgerdemannia flammicorona]